jgi:hypothetical protein
MHPLHPFPIDKDLLPSMKLNSIFAALIFTLLPHIGQAPQPTLSQLKAKYLNQRITINTSRQRTIGGDTLSGWAYPDQDALKKGVYQAAYRDLPSSYLDKEGTIIGLRFGSWRPDKPVQQSKVNGLGETINGDDRPVGHEKIEYIVRFDDGTVAIGSEVYNQAVNEILGRDVNLQALELVSIRHAREDMIDQNLPGVIGKDLYIPGYAFTFSLDTTAGELADIGDSAHKRIGRLHLPLMEPARITDAKYIRNYEIVVLKLKLVDGREMLTRSVYRDHPIHLPGTGSTQSDSFLDRVSGSLLTEIPKMLTSEEIQAIKNQEIFKGMSRTAVEYLRGKPIRESNWAEGGTQLIYKDISIFVNDSGKVANWNKSIEAF